MMKNMIAGVVLLLLLVIAANAEMNDEDTDKEIGADIIGAEGEKVDPSHFEQLKALKVLELLKVVEQGSFGKNDEDTDKEIEIGADIIGAQGEKVDPSHFEQLKVLEQGSFGKVNDHDHKDQSKRTDRDGKKPVYEEDQFNIKAPHLFMLIVALDVFAADDNSA